MSKVVKKRKAPKKKESTVESFINGLKVLPHAIFFVMILNGLALASFVVPTGSMENEVMTGDFLFVNRFKYGPTTPQVVPLLNIPLPNYKFPGFWEPEVGDVIVFEYPGEMNEIENEEFIYFLKRCVATAGDEFQIINQKIFVNGEHVPDADNVKHLFPVNNSRTRFPLGNDWTLDNYGPIRIPKEGDEIVLTEDNFSQWAMFIRREGHNPVYNQLTGEITIDGEATNIYKVERNYCFGVGDNRHNSDDSRSWGFIPYENVVGTPMIVYWSWDTGIPFSKLIDKVLTTDFSRIGTLIN